MKPLHFVFAERTYCLRFQHRHFESPIPLADSNPEKLSRGKTTCLVVDLSSDTEVVVAMGCAYCAVGDNFNRAIGRQLALKRALLRAAIVVNDRRFIQAGFEAYAKR